MEETKPKRKSPPNKIIFQKKWCKMLVEHMAAGYGYYAFAGKLKCSIDTMCSWEKIHPEWLEAKKEAFAQSEVYWDKLAADSCQPGNAKLYNSIMIIFNLKNRFPTRWKNEHEEKETKIKVIEVQRKTVKPPPPKKEDNKDGQ